MIFFDGDVVKLAYRGWKTTAKMSEADFDGNVAKLTYRGWKTTAKMSEADFDGKEWFFFDGNVAKLRLILTGTLQNSPTEAVENDADII